MEVQLYYYTTVTPVQMEVLSAVHSATLELSFRPQGGWCFKLLNLYTHKWGGDEL